MEFEDPNHFKTQDRQLAIALATSGCKLAPSEQGGPAINRYTPDTLRAKGLLPKEGVSVDRFEAAVKLAAERKIPGIVTYLFVRDAVFERAIAAWDGMVKEVQSAEAAGRSPVAPEIDEATAMQVLYARRVMAASFDAAPFYQTPLLELSKSTTTMQEIPGSPGKKSVTKGSAKIWSLGLKTTNPEAYAQLFKK